MNDACSVRNKMWVEIRHNDEFRPGRDGIFLLFILLPTYNPCRDYKLILLPWLDILNTGKFWEDFTIVFEKMITQNIFN